MVPKITTSESSRACFEYDLRKKHADDPPGLWIGGTVFGSAREMAKQMAFFRKLRPDCKRPIISFSLSLPRNDGRPKPQKWERMVERFLEKMGVDTKTHGWVAHEHVHDNAHVHIRLCRISSEGKLWNQENSAKRAIKVCAELEEEFQLEKHDRIPSAKKRPSMAEIQISKRKGIPMSRKLIQDKVDWQIKNHTKDLDFQDLQKLLAVDSIDMQPYESNGVLVGVSYTVNDIRWPGSKIGRAYSAGLLERGVRYNSKDPAEKIENATKSQLSSSKMPSALKSILLPEQFGTKEIKPHAAHQTEVTLNTERFNSQVINLNLGPASTAMLLIAGALAKASLFLVNMVIAFLKRLMAFFGFGVRQSTYQAHEHPDASAPALCYEPAPLALPVPKSAEDKAAMELYQVARALEENDPNLLPVLDDPEVAKARANVVTAMDEQVGKGVGTTAAETENFGITDEDFASTNAVSEPEPPTADPLTELQAALAGHKTAARELELAEIKNGPVHFSTVAQRQNELKIVREDLDAAKSKWDEFCTQHALTWRLPSAEKTRLRQNLDNNLEAEKRAVNAVAAAEAEDARIKKLYASLPPAIVPVQIKQSEAQARQAVTNARVAIQDEAAAAIKALRNDIMMSPQMAKIESLLRSSYSRFVILRDITDGEFIVLQSQIQELRRLKAAQENARIAALAERESDESDKPVVDGQIVK